MVNGPVLPPWLSNVRRPIDVLHGWWGYPPIEIGLDGITEIADPPQGRTALLVTGGADSSLGCCGGTTLWMNWRMSRKKWKKKKRRLLDHWSTVRCQMRRRLLCRATVVGVTGSCGKTTASYLLAKILNDHEPTLTAINHNGRAAIVKALGQVKPSHRFYVQELGADVPGSMRLYLPLLRPHIGIVTTIGQDHYSNFRTLEATAKEKGLLAESLPITGVAVLNADDPQVLAMAARTTARTFTYGGAESADVRATDIRAAWPERLSFTVSYQGETVRIETGLFGNLPVTSVLAAVAGALAAGMDLNQCAQSLHGVQSFERRMSIDHTPQGIWLINDTFKAPYWSIQSVVMQLEGARAPRKTCVFGSFSDVPGARSAKYRATAKRALTVADRVIFVGKKATHIRKLLSAETEGRLLTFDTSEQACGFLAQTAINDELVFLKSNNLDHLERLVEGLNGD